MAITQLATLNQVVSQASMEIGIAQKEVSQVIGSQDQDIVQMQALLRVVATEVLDEEPYNSILGDGLWIIDHASGDFKLLFDNDADLVAFDARLAVNGLKWRFLKAKNLEFGEEQRDYITRMNKLAAKANARVLDLDMDESRVQ